MKRITLALITALTFSAACTVQSVPEIAHYQGQQIDMRVTVDATEFINKYTLTFDGEIVLEQKAKLGDGNLQTFRGQWRGKPVMLRVIATTAGWTTHILGDVFIDGRHVDTITIL